MSLSLIVLLVLIVVLVALVIGIYNGLVNARNMLQNAFAQIDVQLKRRFDLIPNLVETAKAYMAHERGTLEAVIAARNAAQQAVRTLGADLANAQAAQAVGHAEAQLGTVMSRFMALSENYPDLKANTTMMQLNEELSTTENKVAFARQAYNDAVMDYNNRCQNFPAVLFAAMLGFRSAQSLEVIRDEAEREAPKVKFS